MGATRRYQATTPRHLRFAAAVSTASRRIAPIPSTAFSPILALPLAARGWMRAVRAAALGFVVTSALCALIAWPADAVAKGNRVPAWYPGPSCNDPAVLDQIVAEFRGRHWASGGFESIGIGPADWESWPQQLIPRRFCEWRIRMWRGAQPVIRPLYYAIIATDPGYRLEWCVVGLDRPWPYDPRCRLARP